MKIFKNKFFFAAVAAALFLSVFSAVLTATGRTDILRGGVMAVTHPVRWAMARCADGVNGLGKYFGASKALNEENESLREALARTADEEARLAELLVENERLRAYLGILSAHPDYRFEEALVTGRGTEKYTSVLTLNRGSIHGIAVGMSVITPDGLVGSVTEVGLTYCRVRTILSGATSVGAYIPRSGVLGVVRGDISYGENGAIVCVMQYLEQGTPDASETESGDATGGTASGETGVSGGGTDETGETSGAGTVGTSPDYLALYGIDVRIGDRVLTTGVGAVYPSGLEIGRISSVSVDPYSRKLTLIITPSANLTRGLDYVLILKETGGGT